MAQYGSRHRLPLALVWPTGLVLLVGVLAFFQYKWLGQVSESERDRLRTSLDQRAHEFADDFDREIGGAYVALQISADSVKAKDWTAFAKRYDDWKDSARFPQMIRNIYLTADPKSSDPLLQFDPGARTFRETTWPAELELVKSRVKPFSDPLPPPSSAFPEAIRWVALGASPIVADVPAILVPVEAADHMTSTDRGSMLSFRLGPAFLVLELDRPFLENTLLPALIDRHFAADDYHLAVADTHTPDRPFFTKGVTSATALKPKDADASIAFFSVRLDGIKQAVAALQPTITASGATSFTRQGLKGTPGGAFSIVVQQDRLVPGVGTMRTGNVQFGGGAWQIVLQHSAGSLEAAVTRARVRNLSLSFGVLAVLTAGVFLISINAQRAQRLAAQQMDFVATVSHELRTPLAVIRSAAQNLSAGVVHEPEQAKRYGDLIDAEGRRLTDMVEQVLTYAGISDSKRAAATAPTDIAALTRDIVTSCGTLIREAGFTVDVTIGEHLPEVPLDEAAYRRALNNLIVNALKYGTDGLWLGVNVQLANDEVQVAVSDRGRGIDPADLPHIFEAFYRGQYAKDRQIHGNGLGLSLVKGIAEAHGGRVTVTSTPGAGATFTLHLPA
jgi:signal transduction histidine kinase